MIDIRGNTAKRRYGREYRQGLTLFERYMYTRINTVLKMQYRAASKDIEQGQFTEIPRTINKYRERIYRVYLEEFQRIGAVYNQEVHRRLKEKQYTIFWIYFFQWLKLYAAEKVTKIDETTKDILKNIIEVKKLDGYSNVMIAGFITENIDSLTNYRSARIARTEVHTGTNTAIHESVALTERVQEHEWGGALDERERSAHAAAEGQRVPMDQPFLVMAEELRYPGDPNGSAANVINCRCFELFHTREAA